MGKQKMKGAIGFGAVLHDVGKMVVPDPMLLKPDNLTAGDRDELRNHGHFDPLLVATILPTAPEQLQEIAGHYRSEG